MTARTTPRTEATRAGQSAASRPRAMRSQFDAGSVTGGQTDLQRLGALVRSLRSAHGLSTRALARRSASARSSIQRLERGTMRPRRSLLSAVALGMDPDRQKELLEQLEAAAGGSVAADTDGTRGWRRRRLERGILNGSVPLPAKLARGLELHRKADQLFAREMALLDQPGAFDDAAVLEEALRLSEEHRKLRDQAGAPIVFHVGRQVIRAGWGMP